MIPTSIEIVHDLQNHEHTVCTSASLTDQHIHVDSLECDVFHKQITIFSVDFTTITDVIPQHYYTTIFTDESQTFKEIYHTKKTNRGPPNFTV